MRDSIFLSFPFPLTFPASLFLSDTQNWKHTCIYISINAAGSSGAKGIGYSLAALTDEVLISFEHDCEAEYINGSLLALVLVCSGYLDKSNDGLS